MFFLLYMLGVTAYATVFDFKPEAKIDLGNSSLPSLLSADSSYSFFIWNLGYAGLGAESDFFYDGGVHANMPKEIVDKNFKGILSYINMCQKTDFVLFQEIDKYSTRSAYVDQVDSAGRLLKGHKLSFAYNFKVDLVPLPITDPVGHVRSGLSSFSLHTSSSNFRMAYPSQYEWPRYCFMLDRCFLLQRFTLDNGKELLVLNNHNSAFDGGKLKSVEMDHLRKILLSEYAKGNYIVAGGDWNQCPPDFNPDKFKKNAEDQYFPENISADYYPEGWSWVYDPDMPTNRKVTKAYDPSQTFTTIIDYYLVSPNIEVVQVKGIDHDFAFSDHQAVYLKVRLKKQRIAE